MARVKGRKAAAPKRIKQTAITEKFGKSEKSSFDFNVENLQIVAWIIIATSFFLIYRQVREFIAEYKNQQTSYQNYLTQRRDYLVAEKLRVETGKEHEIKMPEHQIEPKFLWGDVAFKSFALILRVTVIELAGYYIYDPKSGINILRSIGIKSSKGAYTLAGLVLMLYRTLDTLIMIYWIYLLGSVAWDLKIAYDTHGNESTVSGKLYNFFGFNIPASVISVASERFSDIILLFVVPYLGQIFTKIQSFAN